MSDDEKPLGWRAEEVENKQKRASKRAEGGGQPGSARKAAPAKKPAAAAPAAAGGAGREQPAQQPVQRRRREAAAGVAAAVQAVAAVQAAAAADGSSSDEERPSSARRGGRQGRQARQQAPLDEEEAEAEAYAASLLAKVTGKPLPGQQKAAAFYGRQGSGGGVERKVSMGQSEEDVRSKVRQEGARRALEGRLAVQQNRRPCWLVLAVHVGCAVALRRWQTVLPPALHSTSLQRVSLLALILVLPPAHPCRCGKASSRR